MSDHESAPAKAHKAEGGFYIQSLDGLRAISILIVFFHHGFLKGIVPGGLGVTIFFFLSGYLITTLLRLEADRYQRISLGQFYLRRVLRIFPPMYLSLFFAVGVAWLFWPELIKWRALVYQCLHLTNYYMTYGPDPLGACTLGTDQLWSLAVEEHFYLVFPLFYIFLRRFVPRPSMQVLVMGIVCVLTLVWRIYRASQLDLTVTQELQRISLGTDTRIDALLFGCMLAVYRNPALDHYAHLTLRRGYAMTAIGLAILLPATVFGSLFFRETFRYSLQGLALVPLFIAAIRFGGHWPWKLLNVPIVRHIGVLSYSLYLFHGVVIHFFRDKVFHVEGVRSGLAVVSDLVALLASIALVQVVYLLVEKPAARLRKRLSRVHARNSEEKPSQLGIHPNPVSASPGTSAHSPQP